MTNSSCFIAAVPLQINLKHLIAAKLPAVFAIAIAISFVNDEWLCPANHRLHDHSTNLSSSYTLMAAGTCTDTVSESHVLRLPFPKSGELEQELGFLCPDW
jgi:hypothetical protein